MTAGYSTPTCKTPFGKNTQHLMGNGQSAQISAGYRFGRRFGVVGSYGYATNVINKTALLETVGQSQQAADWKASASNCTLQSLMVGPLLTVPTGRFIFDFQLTGGVAKAFSPRMELYSDQPRSPMHYHTPSQTAYAPAAGLGVTTRYKLSRWLAVHASIQYITADLKYENLEQQIQIGNQHSVEAMPASQPVGLLNLGGGFSFLF